MSSHREAPAISKDPVADNTDTYAFVSPDDPGTVTIIANYLPLEAPFGGPNFFEFGPDVRYRINVDNDGDGDADVIYEFAFQTQVANPNSFLYNSGPINSNGDPNWNERFQPGSFGCHELLDRTALVSDLLQRYVLAHPACALNPDWYALANQAAAVLCELYQRIGAAHMNERHAGTGTS